MSTDNTRRAGEDGAGSMLRSLRKAPRTSVVSELGAAPEDVRPPVEQAPQQAPEPTPAPVQQPAQTVQPAAAEPPAAPVNPEPAKAKREKLSYYQDADGAHRLRATHVSTQAQTGYRSLSDFIAAAVEKECARLEAAYNDGELFRTGANAVKRGRPYDFG